MNRSLIPMLDIPAMHAPIEKALEEAILDVLRSGSYINGAAVDSFERQLAQWVDAAHVIGVSSGTDALLISLMALGVRPGDKIITTVFSFFATAGAIARLGAIPVFVDVHPDTFNIDAQAIAGLIDDDTVGIVPVHIFGAAANMATICEIAEARNLWVVEDAAQALGATSDDRHVGTIGDAGTYSFFPGKNLGAAGDAGAVVTNNSKLAQKIQHLRTHGAIRRHCHHYIGGNFRMDTIQAALLQVKLPHLESWHHARTEAAERYRLRFSGHPNIICPPSTPGHAWNQYVIQLPNGSRQAVIESLENQRIHCAIHYPLPLHLQPALKYLGYGKGDFPVAENIAGCALALPINPTITAAEQDLVATIIKDTLENAPPSP